MVGGSNPLAATSFVDHPMQVSPLAYRVHQVIRREKLLTPGARVVVGVSGGPDSVALLGLLAELREVERLALWGVYVNHGWRPRAARREIALVRRLGERLGVPITIAMLAPRKRPRHSWEGTAREHRYAALAQVARRVRAAAVAVGHTVEDQAETVLLALLRGSGLAGVGGMRWRRPLRGGRVALIRPLLGIRHEELRAYLRRHRFPWAFDATNRAQRFRRNQIRHAVLPSLAARFGAQVVDRLVTFAQIAREDDGWLQSSVERWCRRHASIRAGTVRIPLAALRRRPVAIRRRALRWALAQVAGSLQGITFRHLAGIAALLKRGTGAVHLPAGIVATAAGGALRICRRGPLAKRPASVLQ